LGFLFVFLPLAIIIYAFTPGKYKNISLFVINAVYYLLMGWQITLITAAAAVMDYATALFLDVERGKKLAKLRMPLLILMTIKNIGGAVVFAVLGEFCSAVGVCMFMVYALTATGYLVDVFAGEEAAERNPIRYFLFSTLFCKMHIGPLVRWKDMKTQLAGTDGRGKRGFSLESAGEGLVLFLYGAAKKVLLADRLAEFAAALEQVNMSAPSVLGRWIAVIIFALRIFFELSGFSDMARGLGMVFGLKLPMNFYYPYQSLSVSDFLYRFNTTVAQFFEHYVYNTLSRKKHDTETNVPQTETDGRKKTILSDILNALLVCLLFGMWFGIDLKYLLWGVYLAVFIVIEKYLIGRFLDNIPKLFARLYSFAAVMCSFVIFSTPDGYGILENAGALLAFSEKGVSTQLLYLLNSNKLLLGAAVLFATSLFSVMARVVGKKTGTVVKLVQLVWSLVLLTITVSFLL